LFKIFNTLPILAYIFHVFKEEGCSSIKIADCQGICLVIARFQVRCPVRAFCCCCCFLGYSLDKKLYFFCLSHQLLNQEHIVHHVIRAQLISSSIADVAIFVKKSLKKIAKHNLVKHNISGGCALGV